MAYVPPHKRHSIDEVKQSSSSSNVDDQLQNPTQVNEFRYQASWQPLSKWFIVPSIDANQHTVPLKIIKWEDQDDSLIIVSDNVQKQQTDESNERNPTIFVCDYLPKKDFESRNMKVYEILNNSVNNPWRCIDKEIQGDLVSSLQNLRRDLSYSGSRSRSGLEISPSFIVKLGTNFFGSRRPRVDLDSVNNSCFKTTLSELYRGHSALIRNSSTESICTELVTKLGLEFHAEKEYYHVKVVDNYRHGYFTCKCIVNKIVGELKICKIGWNPKRHLILDISYLNKKLDPRLMLSAKRVFATDSIAEEMCSLSKLMKSAIIDPKEKGGLRWPAENNPLFRRYVIDGVVHITSNVFKSSTMKLKLSRTDEYYSAIPAHLVKQPVTLEMTEIERRLSDEATELDTIIGMVKDTLKLLWEDFP